MMNKKTWNLHFLKDLNHRNSTSGLVAAIFVISGPCALILEASSNGNFTLTQTIMWVFSVYVIGGLFGIILPLYYRIPIVGGHTLTGVAFLATMTAQFTFNELIGSYIVSGIFVLLIGSLGVFSRLIKLVPKEIISAMLSGMITHYMMNFILSVTELLVVGTISLLMYLILTKRKTKIPPVLAAILTGFIVLLLMGLVNSSDALVSPFFMPEMQLPEINLLSILSVSIPLAILILSNDIAVAVSALEQNKYPTPIGRILTSSGLFSIITSFFGGQSANIAGMATVICSGEEAGPKEKRYMGAVVTGVLLLIFGLFSWKLIPFIQALPSEFISIIVGFSLIGVFGNSLYQGFSNPSMKISASFAFMIALSNISILNISAPVWALLVGTVIANYVENDSNRTLMKGEKETA
ncbi:benzoate/H(+) symporter BenE family transporter [Mesobacillus maritimus]|uniref:Benzoate/H(+) symporter BenE family transporter n=1 Tax=Mesobacillus maritimus TaxID=1643336 RepID=A0ABS7K6P9_9BACI|nr:benzoate/H(+) symporter BenE family transporter [Mesobacillus maritimus]MBY0097948.1 benzoate/H(+) symporter BenE family transporter [Mesobacillus maritimus]